MQNNFQGPVYGFRLFSPAGAGAGSEFYARSPNFMRNDPPFSSLAGKRRNQEPNLEYNRTIFFVSFEKFRKNTALCLDFFILSN